MAMGRLSARAVPERSSSQLAVALAPRHQYYDNCNALLREAEFDHFVEMLFQDYYADDGRPSIPPGRYARMLFIGQWESLDSERECFRHFWGDRGRRRHNTRLVQPSAPAPATVAANGSGAFGITMRHPSRPSIQFADVGGLAARATQ